MNEALKPRRARLLALLLAAGAAACAGSSRSPSAAAREVHPEVSTEGAVTCSGCHAEVTPEATAAWREGRHGLALVECVVCHGSTGADFRLRPESGTCAGCHAAEVRSATLADGRTQDCFSCHRAHALTPKKGKSPHHHEGGRP